MGFRNYWFFTRKPENDSLPPAPILPRKSIDYKSSISGSSSVSTDFESNVRHEMVVAYLYQQQCNNSWISDRNSNYEGALMRASWDKYISCPEGLEETRLSDACIMLNAQIALTVHSKIVKAFFMLQHSQKESVLLRSGLKIQIVESIQDLAHARKHQFAAFIRKDSFLLVWDDDPNNIIDRAADIERQLVEISWRDTTGHYPLNDTRRPSIMPSALNQLEAGNTDERPRIFINGIMSAFTMVLIFGALGLGWSQLAQQIKIDGSYTRLALIAMAPIQIFLCIFFMQTIITCLFQLFGPIGQMQSNTRYYSGVTPHRLNADITKLPHVTIQCPVYTEGLQAVIEPTIKSLKDAISTYEMQGGTANIFVNDDGMQAKLAPIDVQKRKDFYLTHNIGWVARPAHNPTPADDDEKPFIRRGKFKKASNMNYALMISSKVEERLAEIERHEDWTETEETLVYEKSLKAVLSDLNDKPLAGGNIRMGDYILLVDSDTRVPKDCLLDAVSELEQSPELAILQYSAGVLLVANDFFENGIAFFTHLIYTAMSYMVANGDMAPFVGHNAVLRWTAMQDVAYLDEDQYVKFWSESSVSEDFDMSLRLQCEGWSIRLGTYAGDGFKEGVSLTVYDELTRWEKYAYGCSEMLFHPLRYWPTRGPFTPLIRKFVTSKIPLAMKISTLGYVGTYYAIGCSWMLVLMNYFLIGWYNGELDHWYTTSFNVYFSLVVVFNGLCNLTLALLRYRIQEKTFLRSLFENIMWIPLFVIFFGGISLSVSQALFCHILSIDISWGTTVKEVENSNFFQEIPKLFQRFKLRFAYCISCVALMVVCAVAVPYQWRITGFTAIYPLAIVVGSHFLLPIALNPALMRFTW